MKKLRACLRCDRPFVTTAEIRICQCCKHPDGNDPMKGVYPGYWTARASLARKTAMMPMKVAQPRNTRSKE